MTGLGLVGLMGLWQNSSHTSHHTSTIGWFDNCTLRFLNYIFGSEDDIPSCYRYNRNNVSDVDGYGKSVKSLLDSMISEDASSNRKFATKTSVAPDLSKLYGFVQCTPDLSEQQCNNCLEMTSSQLPLYSIGKGGGRFYTPSCNFSFDTYFFFNLELKHPCHHH